MAVLELVVRDGEKGPAERIGMGDGGCRRVDGRFAGGVLFLRTERAVLALHVPGGQSASGRRLKKLPTSGSLIVLRRQHCVIDIPRPLLPGIKNDFLIGVVGMERTDHALGRIIEHRGTYAVWLKTIAVMRAEERLKLPHRFPFVVVHRRPGADPAWLCRFGRIRLGLHFRLRYAAKAVRVGEGVLDFGGDAVLISDMGLRVSV